jgi:hypothetical protein
MISKNLHKYPRTYHLPWSESKTDDDKTLTIEQVLSNFSGKTIVVTEKLDGENTTIYSDGYCHARSIDSRNHESRSYIKSLAAKIGCELPEGWRLMGENLFAKHSIEYNRLPDYFILFGIADQSNIALSWNEVKQYGNILGLYTAPILYMGAYDEISIRNSQPSTSAFGGCVEGYVVRNASNFSMNDFSKNVAKFVRANHIQSKDHWMYSPIITNKLS